MMKPSAKKWYKIRYTPSNGRMASLSTIDDLDGLQGFTALQFFCESYPPILWIMTIFLASHQIFRHDFHDSMEQLVVLGGPAS